MKPLTSLSSYKDRIPYPLFYSLAKLWGQIPLQWRLGSGFTQTFKSLKKSEYWDPAEIREWQLSCLRKIVRHAANRVPWYRNTFKSIGLDWRDIKTLKDIKYIPTITKTQIRENSAEFIAEGVSHNSLRPVVTGGSTGSPLRFYIERENASVEVAFLAHILQLFGGKFGERSVVLRTQQQSRNPKTPYWMYNPHRNQLVINSYLISETSVPQIAREIRRFKPNYVLAIPSTAALFSHYLLDSSEDIGIPPQVVLLGSENSYKSQRELISKAFGCQTIMHYGQTEGVAMAFESCEYGKYQVNPFYGLGEVINEAGEAVLRPGSQGEIIGTSFHNFAMPLIRYRTGDIATISLGTSRWGLEGDLWERIDGRTVELIQTRDGRWIVAAALMFGTHDETLSNVAELQIEQRLPGHATIRLIKRPRYNSKDELNIRAMVNTFTNKGLDVNFEYVTYIPRTKAGKHKFLIQHINLPKLFDR